MPIAGISRPVPSTTLVLQYFVVFSSLTQFARDLWQIKTLPSVEIDLRQLASRDNDEFYQKLVKEFYDASRKRHPRFPLIPQFSVGVATCRLPTSFDEYFAAIEASARRNVKKARRLGYEFRLIHYNDHLDEITEIRRSTDTRQGAVSKDFLEAAATPTKNPDSRNPVHDYPYFGVFKDGALWAYAGCFVCGEVCLLEHIYGHAARHSDGIVPLLITGIAEHLIQERAAVRYYCYGTFFGARQPMRRFKRKFLFLPHRVTWKLSS